MPLRLIRTLLLACLLLPALAQAASLADTRFTDLKGQSRTLTDWRGRVVVVNFWATWCAPCREEMPMLNTYAQKWGPHGVSVVGIALDQAVEVKNFVQMFSITYPVLLGGNQAAMDLMRANGNPVGALPFTLVLDRQGRPVARITGRLTEEQLDAVVLPRR
ncbi:TlpA family protein disulfide reductase [Laribacter hongkongensis]|jgi:thiol-disulfide isomerase/thioredoxin|nr:TlpA disulfide reductase family protein [Laribacter hongkongensis]MBP8814064.1 TlpA family protein disulfide reductase [Laribacter sp.]MBE5529614.1 hypothetical protein [Laribacter hongkongensis]MBP9608788.1 TlpA family protein disulfide reductase [Laribacter sp.]MCG8992187.1 TlpA family protein disulfide reductase [Laribacter hongkongensis]MCG8995229.1 TlpA family protein disulfide reductase [Laribacter hongkongensis]